MGKVDETIEKIMQATVRVAFNKGFANTRTADIAKEAGVSEGLIFKYFPTKSNLFALIIKSNFERFKAGVDKIITNTSLSATAKIDALIEFHFEFFNNQLNIANLIFGHSDRKSIESVDPILEYGLIPYSKLMIAILEEGINSGEFKTLHPEVIATAIIGGMQINLFKLILTNRQDEMEITKNELKEYILSSIVKR